MDGRHETQREMGKAQEEQIRTSLFTVAGEHHPRALLSLMAVQNRHDQ
jgi:hypothetical protein